MADIQLGKSINLFLPVVDDLERALKKISPKIWPVKPGLKA